MLDIWERRRDTEFAVLGYHCSLVRHLWQKKRNPRQMSLLYFNQRWDDATIERQQKVASRNREERIVVVGEVQ